MSDYTTYVAALAPVAWYKCQETSGNPADSSGNGYNMTSASGLTYHMTSPLAASEADYAISAAGAGYASLASAAAFNVDYNAAFTVMAWVKFTGTGSMMLFTKWAATGAYPFALWVNAGKGAVSRSDATNNPVCYTDGNINDGNWHHLVGRKSGGAAGTLQCMVDGAIQATTATDSTTATCTNSVAQYLCAAGTSYYLTGSVDEVMFWASALTWEQCAGIYTRGLLGLTPKLAYESARVVLSPSRLNYPQIFQ